MSLLGALMVCTTVLIHAFGTSVLVRRLTSRYDDHASLGRVRLMLQILSTAAVVLLILHLVEVALWAGLYLAILPADAWTAEKALYFSLVTFTTLGYGDITLTADWRLLSGIEALNGILLVGWSTALLFAILQRIWQAQTALAEGRQQTEKP